MLVMVLCTRLRGVFIIMARTSATGITIRPNVRWGVGSFFHVLLIFFLVDAQIV